MAVLRITVWLCVIKLNACKPLNQAYTLENHLHKSMTVPKSAYSGPAWHRNLQQPQCTPAKNRLSKLCRIPTMDCHTAVKWMNHN